MTLQQEKEEASDESDVEEPSPEALARYLSMRRHTFGVSDARFVKLSIDLKLREDRRDK